MDEFDVDICCVDEMDLESEINVHSQMQESASKKAT